MDKNMSLNSSASAQITEKVLSNIDWRNTQEADVVLLAARSELHLLHWKWDNKKEKLAREALDHLGSVSKIRNDEHIGWGVEHVFDTFAKGIPNPVNTVYSYTTAAAALAYLDAYVILKDEKYLEIAEKAAHTLLTLTGLWKKDGYLSVWYSDQVADQKDIYQCHNVNALTLAVLSRIDRYRRNERFAGERAGMLKLLVDDQGEHYDFEEAKSPFNWRYSRGRIVTNDWLHEAFIIEGLLESADPVAHVAAIKSLAGMGFVHFDFNGVPRFDNPLTKGVSGWGPPAGLYAFSSMYYFEKQTKALAVAIAASIANDGKPIYISQKDDYYLRGYGLYALSLARYTVWYDKKAQLLPRRCVDIGAKSAT